MHNLLFAIVFWPAALFAQAVCFDSGASSGCGDMILFIAPAVAVLELLLFLGCFLGACVFLFAYIWRKAKM